MNMSSRFEDKARELHSNGINCSNSLYFAFKDIFDLGDNVPQPRSIDGLCGTVLTTEYILKRLGKVEYIKEYLYLNVKYKCLFHESWNTYKYAIKR